MKNWIAIGIISIVVLVAGALVAIKLIGSDRHVWAEPISWHATYPDFDNDNVSDDNTIRITGLCVGGAQQAPEQIFACISCDNFTSTTVYFKGPMPANVRELAAETDANGNFNVENRWCLEITADLGTKFTKKTKISVSYGGESRWTITDSPIILTRRQDNLVLFE